MDLSLAGRPPPGRRHGRRRAAPVPVPRAVLAAQEEAKHEHVRQVARAPPELRAEVAVDLAGRGPTPIRITACAVRLLDLGFFRIGSDRHTRFRETHGLTTMLREHVGRGRGEITFSYPAEGGVETVRALVDQQLRTVARALLRRPRGGDRFLAHHARGRWHCPGNTPAVCRSSCTAPAVFELFEPRGRSRRRFLISWTASVDDSSGRDAFYALLHDRTRSSLHLPSTGPGARGVPGQARRAALQDHGDRRSGHR
ncbi:hypothetical protein [Streptomyces sp. NPDC054783]